MGIRVALHHTTTYEYSRPVRLGPQTVRLRPAPHCRTPVEAFSLRVDPSDHFCNWLQDPFGNYAARLVFPETTRRLTLDVDIIADLVVFNPFDFFLEPDAETFPVTYDKALRHDLEQCLVTEPAGPLLEEFLATIDRSERSTIDFLVDLNRRIASEIAYTSRLEPGLQSCEETLRRRVGACRDSGWLLVQVLRRLGLAARFASGYLVQLVPDVQPTDGPAGPERDFTDLHAWAEVYLPGAGWVGLDPTSGLLAGEGHIPVACTPDPTSAAPVTGAIEPCDVQFAHEMSVTRLDEPSRPSKPYNETTWARIDDLAQAVDRDLERLDVRLTMGGEPTFVSIDDMESDQWNDDALGDDKHRLAHALARRLQQRFAPGGLLHEAHGEWYPGEPMPRWAFTLIWRHDGQPIWNNPERLAPRPTTPSTDQQSHDEPNPGADHRLAHTFIRRLAQRIACNPDHALPAYEDAFYSMWKEKALPDNIDPHDPRFLHEPERRRLSRILRQGFDHVVGYALPLDIRAAEAGDRSGEAAERWTSGPWVFRSGRMELIPGDSPMGLRLPLDSIEYDPERERRIPAPQDPMEPRGPLPPARLLMQRQDPPDPPAAESGREPHHLHTALCVEPRAGRLHVFLPPTRRAEHYLALIAAIEHTAERLDTPVVLEGYEPPHDHRLRRLRVTPDPGVIKLNVHPNATWRELAETTEALYNDARAERLGADKFTLDGRHVGSGGGAHVILGGPTPADSPILRRPDLLRSFLAFWNNHPSLTSLFNEPFVGPTSQPPRATEARADAVSELAIAFDQIDDDRAPPPRRVDRLFRHLLTGNTHRSEFCIDKLDNPDAPTGRLGLLEFRAFGMPPHHRMNLAQQLLLRTLVAAFWQRPYTARLVHWGAALDDRWALPEFIRADLEDVCAEIRDRGYPLDPAWFRPHFEFRFPRLGLVARKHLELELRTALEPRRVLGQEAAAGGVSRAPDSALERLQIKARGLTEGRHAVLCNGRRLPLHPTGVDGEHVAGVRFRAWQPPRCLHPIIPPHAPLVFDIIDTWAADARGRSLGGGVYHVAHPGGRSYDTRPVNAQEAESRRASRFVTIGHTPGPLDVPAEPIDPRAPMTLDLRTTPPLP